MGRFLRQDPDPGKLTVPISVTNKYSYAGNNPFGNRVPSGKSWLSDRLGINVDLNKGVKQSVQQIISGGHDFIQAVGSSVDSLLKSKETQRIILIACIVVAAYLTGGWAAQGLSGWSAVAAGAAGGAGDTALGVGTFEEGFIAGAAVGAMGASTQGMLGNGNPVFKYVNAEYKLYKSSSSTQYFFGAFTDNGMVATKAGGGFVGTSSVGHLL